MGNEGHRNTSISGDTLADWSGAFELGPRRTVVRLASASAFTLEVRSACARSASASAVPRLGEGAARLAPGLPVAARALLVRQEEGPPPFSGPGSDDDLEGAELENDHGRKPEGGLDHPKQKPVAL